MYKLIFTDDRNFDDRLWQKYYNLLEILHQRYKATLASQDWLELKSRTLSYYKTNRHYRQALVLGDDSPIIWADFRVHNPGRPEQSLVIAFHGVFERMPIEIEMLILDWYIQEIEKHGANEVYGTFFNEHLERCARSWGGQQLSKQDQYYLYRETANHPTLKKWLETIPSRNPGLKLEFFEEVPDRFLPEFVNLLDRYLNDMPKEEGGSMPFHYGEKEFREHRQWRRENSCALSGYILLDSGRNIVGISKVLVNRNMPRYVRQLMTGVNRDYRGRGLAKWLKAAAFYKIGEEFPENEALITEMRAVNRPILKINEQMGYILERTGREYKIPFSSIKAYRREL